MRKLLEYIGACVFLAGQVVYRVCTRPFIPANVTAHQITLLINRCLLPVLVVVFTVGAVISLQAANLFQLVTAEPLLGGISTLFTFREISPVLAGIMIAAQGGTCVSTEIGAMRIKEELDAMELMAVDPIRYAIAPRFVAFVISVPVLTILANVAGIAGAFVVALVVTHNTPQAYLDSIIAYVSASDIWNGLIKSTIFGISTATIACYNGYSVKGGAAEVGAAANKSIVYSIIALLFLNYILTVALFGAETGIQKF